MSGIPVGRFAPTPSGRLHLGNLMCAMIAWLSVRSRNGRFLLRIEDPDPPRCPRGLALQIIKDLKKLGFDWDEEPIWQSERSDAYEEALRQLKELGLLYPCFCSRAELHSTNAPNAGDTQFIYAGTCRNLTPEQILTRSAVRKPAWRVRVPDREIAFTDVLYGTFRENPAIDCGDFIVRRSDGLFGYQLAVVVDDAYSGVTEVVRGRDILSSTPRQIFLQEALQYPHPEYLHIPLLTDCTGRRLAKRDGDLSLDALLTRFTPGEVLGILACSCGLLDRPEPASLRELIPVYDPAKLRRDDIRLPDIAEL